MPTVDEVVSVIHKIAPQSLCEPWDNTGLLVNAGGDANRILVALDITNETLCEAQKLGCTLMVTHHPVIFNPIKVLNSTDVVYKLVQSGISALCAHTNLDEAEGGVNDVLAELLGLTQVCAMQPLGRVGRLAASMSVEAFATFCARKLGSAVHLCGNDQLVRTIAVIGGSGGDYWQSAMDAQADCLLTGEAGHHDALNATAAGFSLIAAGHYETEWPVISVLAQRLQKQLPTAEVLVSKQAPTFRIIQQE